MIFESYVKFLFYYLNSSQNLSQRAQRAERAGPMPFFQRAGPGRAEKKSARAHL